MGTYAAFLRRVSPTTVKGGFVEEIGPLAEPSVGLASSLGNNCLPRQ
jgi:hypothetical protein